jgi:DNA replication protein DnaC
VSESESAAATCPECGGRGWVIEADGGAGTARPCGCRQRDQGPRLLATAGIPALYRRCTLDSFETWTSRPRDQEQLLRAQATCRRYVDEFVGEDGSFSDRGLLLVGRSGVGKTHLAAAVLSELIRRYGVRGRFVDFTSLVHRIQSTFDPSSDASTHQVLDPVMNCEVLVLDELGAQRPTPWVRDTLYLILNTRYTRRLTTLFTTNHRLESEATMTTRSADRFAETSTSFERQVRQEAPATPSIDRQLLGHRIPASLLSRLYEMTTIIEIDAADYRQVKKKNVAG